MESPKAAAALTIRECAVAAVDAPNAAMALRLQHAVAISHVGICTAAAIALGVVACDPAWADVYALDGDDICIGGQGNGCTGGQHYRLHGVDAFEAGQSCIEANGNPYGCGAEAKGALNAIIAERPVWCVPVEMKGRRWIGNCNAGDLDVEVEMLRSGWAFVRPDFLSAERAARLCAIEAEARLAKRGMWAGRWHERPYFRKGGTNKTLVEISCPPHDEAASE
jgi:endonuclease YncB( thermonuclease family)